MSKKTLALMVVGSCLIASANASSPFHKFFPKSISTVTQQQPKAKQAEAYTDFSGTWEGRCGNDDEVTDTLTISNSDTEITLFGIGYNIGGINSTSNAVDSDIGFDHVVFNWDAKKTTLMIDLLSGIVIRSTPASTTDGLMAYAMNFSLSLDDTKQLVFDMNKFLTIRHATAIAIDGTTCTYKKVSG